MPLGRSMDNTEDCSEGDVMGPWRKLVTALVPVPLGRSMDNTEDCSEGDVMGGRSMDNTEDCGEGDVMGPWRKLITALVTVPWAGQWTTQRIAVKEMSWGRGGSW